MKFILLLILSINLSFASLPDVSNGEIISASGINDIINEVNKNPTNTRPAFFINQTAQTLNGYSGVIVLADYSREGGNYFDNGSNLSGGLFTAPIKGIYSFSCTVRMDNIIEGGYIVVILSKNGGTDGANQPYDIIDTTATRLAYFGLSLSTTFKLEVGDTVSVRVVSNTDTSYVISSNGSFSGHLITALD